jgi:VanZ family protein
MLSLKFPRTVKSWLPVLFWMSVIYWMSTDAFSADNTSRIIEPLLYFLFPGISRDAVVLVHGFIRKMSHVSEYFVLGLLLFRAFSEGSSSKEWSLRWAVWAVAAASFYALTDEFHQSFVSTRTASFSDVGIDVMGSLMAQLVNILMYSRRAGKKTVV